MTAEISWTHNIVILEKCKDLQEREFYIRMSKRNGWTYRVLMNQMKFSAFFPQMNGIQRNFPEFVRTRS